MVRLDLLVYFTVSCSLVSGQSLYYGLKGLKVNLKPNFTGVLEEILWKHNNNKVIEFDGEQEQVYGQFKNRVTLDRVSAELNISDLRYEDSGEYEVETYTIKGIGRKKYKLEVIDKVAKPTIMCKRDNGSSCNSDETSSIAWIAVLITAVILVIVLVAAILYCKRKQKGSNKRRAANEENHPFKDSCPKPGLDKPSSPEGLNNVPGSNKDDADADQDKKPDSSASEKTSEPEPDPADTEKTAYKDGEAKSTAANGVSPPLLEL